MPDHAAFFSRFADNLTEGAAPLLPTVEAVTLLPDDEAPGRWLALGWGSDSGKPCWRWVVDAESVEAARLYLPATAEAVPTPSWFVGEAYVVPEAV